MINSINLIYGVFFMFKFKKIAVLLPLTTAILASEIAMADTFAIGPKIGTQGLGLEGRARINDNLIARLGVNYFQYNHTYTEGGVSYKGKLQLLTVPLMLDFHPMDNSGFRVSAGVAYNDNNLKANAKASNSVIINGHVYTPSQIGQMSTKLTLGNKIAGIASIGYDSSLMGPNPFSFSFEAGVMFSGDPKLRVKTTGLAATRQEVRDYESNAREALNQVKKYLRYYPILSIGVKYSF
jgi:hypothetical protein